MISAFGGWATLVASRLPSIDAVISDEANLVHAYLEAVRRRVAGEPFYGLVLSEDPIDRTLRTAAAGIAQHRHDPDERVDLLNRAARGDLVLNGRETQSLMAESAIVDVGMHELAAEFLRLCSAALVRSDSEEQRLRAMSPRPSERVVAEPVLPDVARAPDGATIVVWAADRPGASAAYYAVALHDLPMQRVYVTSDGLPPFPGAGEAYRSDDVQVGAALARAACVIAAEATDPGAAVAFARRRYAVVAPLQSGAHEWIRDLGVFDPRAPRELATAVARALSRPASLRGDIPTLRAQPDLPTVARDGPLPLVSVIVPTFNRRDELAECLACIGAQTYPNVEAVVVNDAGTPVEDVVARFPFARLVDLAQNGGVNRAMMQGLAASRGAYVQFLADDDRLYPDHLERLLSALMHSGAAMAHANALVRYLERKPDGEWLTVGYNAAIFVDTATSTEALISTPIAGHGIVWRRDVFETVGPWREDCALADQEVQLRAAQRFPYVWVDHVTAEWRLRGTENFSAKTNAYDEQRRIYEDLHPTTRSSVVNARAQVLENIRRRPPGFVFPATLKMQTPGETLAGRS